MKRKRCGTNLHARLRPISTLHLHPPAPAQPRSDDTPFHPLRGSRTRRLSLRPAIPADQAATASGSASRCSGQYGTGLGAPLRASMCRALCLISPALASASSPCASRFLSCMLPSASDPRPSQTSEPQTGRQQQHCFSNISVWKHLFASNTTDRDPSRECGTRVEKQGQPAFNTVAPVKQEEYLQHFIFGIGSERDRVWAALGLRLRLPPRWSALPSFTAFQSA